MNIKKMRVQRNMTQEELGEKLGVSRSTVTQWELGVNKPRADMLVKLSRLFNCSIDDLLCTNT